MSIQDTHRILALDAASIKIPRRGGQNGHLGIVLTATQYALVIQFPFVCPTNPVHTPTIPLCKTPSDEKALIREHTTQRQQYDECRNIASALRNQLLTEFEDTSLSPLKNAFTGYLGATTLTLLSNLYGNCARISSTDLADNDKNLGEPCNSGKPLKNLYMRLNKCVDYTTASGEPITAGQVICIAYGLFT